MAADMNEIYHMTLLDGALVVHGAGARDLAVAAFYVADLRDCADSDWLEVCGLFDSFREFADDALAPSDVVDLYAHICEYVKARARAIYMAAN